MNGALPAVATPQQGAATAPVILFVCANCSRPGQAPTSSRWPQPILPEFGWPWPVRLVTVGCTGRIQPEHVLKAFESGASLVCAIGCAQDNCHYLEGSKRCSRRVKHISSVLDEIGLGGRRLMHFFLPGTAVEDMALAAGRTPFEDQSVFIGSRIDAIRSEVIRTLQGLPPNPLHTNSAARDTDQEVDVSDEDSEE